MSTHVPGSCGSLAGWFTCMGWPDMSRSMCLADEHTCAKYRTVQSASRHICKVIQEHGFNLTIASSTAGLYKPNALHAQTMYAGYRKLG